MIYSQPEHKCNLSVVKRLRNRELPESTMRANKIKVRPVMQSILVQKTKPLANKIGNWLRAEAGRIVAELVPEYSKSINLGALVKAKRLTIDDIDLSNWDALAGIVTEETFQVYKSAFESGVAISVVAASTSQPDKRAIAFADKRSAELVGGKSSKWSIAESTRNQLRDTITQSVEDGDSPSSLATKIMDSQAFSDARAMTIARTELAFAHVQGNLDGWVEAGVTGKSSVLGSEHDIDDLCNSAADEGVIGIDEEFSNGFSAPPYHPNCVCDLMPSLP